MKANHYLAILFLIPLMTVHGQEKKEEKERLDKNLLNLSRFTLSGYGVVNYYNYTKFDTDLNIKNKFDAERLNLYLGYEFTDKIKLKTEIEFEHGGTGSTIELDTQEESGEYEHEIEAGGEVKLEQIYIDFSINKYFNVRAGRMKIHFGLAQNLDRPTSYFTTHRQEMENELLPLGWYEAGLQFYGTFANDKLLYEVSVTSGLDSSGFSSRNWIKAGYQTRFEMANAESLALTLRLDYKFGTHKNTYAGAAFYINNASANRPKNDIDVTSYVKILEAHVTYNENNLRFNAIGLYGDIENSDIISRKNATLSNNLGVKRTPVGKKALGFSAEIGYEILHFFEADSKQKLYPFVRYDYYDTMYQTEGAVVKKPRWERNSITGGINYLITPSIVAKLQYQNRTLGSEHIDPVTSLGIGKNQKENTFSAGIAFSF
ncbi:porin [Flavobacterium sp. I3-2]|uniref:porin n=1 Tax=Flavobacterium sp. I3-2 TaxID=2748319 RepID=UPI0015A7F189|nr:porin [Flavobacterium sp. I3-2]